MSTFEIQKFNSANHDWFVMEADSEMARLKCRDTGEMATVHLDELNAVHG